MNKFLIAIIPLFLGGNALACEEGLEPLQATRFVSNVRELAKALEGGAVFVNPAHYEKQHGLSAVYGQTFTKVARALAPAFQSIGEEYPAAAAQLLIKTGSIQARLVIRDGQPVVTRLWLNGVPWDFVVAQVNRAETAPEAFAVLKPLIEDKSRLPRAPLRNGLQELLRAAEEQTAVSLYGVNDRHYQDLANQLNRHLMEKMQQFMDFRTAADVLRKLTDKRMLHVTLRVDPRDGRPALQSIFIIDEAGEEKLLIQLMRELEQSYQAEMRQRMINARTGNDTEVNTDKLISRIYERPDAQPMDRTFWQRFR